MTLGLCKLERVLQQQVLFSQVHMTTGRGQSAGSGR